MRENGFARAGWHAAPRQGDEGFTIVELVMALTLFMIIFVGIMTFMQANVITSARASSRAKAVNVASSYVEQVRALPYNSIGTPSGDPAGVLAVQDFTQGGIAFHVVPTVTWMDDPTVNGAGGVATTHDLKRVVVTVTATSAGGSSPMAATSYALESVVSRAGGQSQPTPLPTVVFDASSPVANTAISGTVHVGALVAATAEGATVTNLNMYADDSQKGLLISPTLGIAQWPPLAWGNTTFQWDTFSVDASGTRRFSDGPHNLTLQVFDSLGKVAFVVRSVYVVNTAPSVPNVVLTASSTTTATGSWAPCTSGGGVPASYYEWEIYDQNYNDGSWTRDAANTTTGTVITYPHVSAFDRLFLRVRSVGPTGLKSAWGSAFVIMRPTLVNLSYSNTFSGNGSGAKWTTTISSPTVSAYEWFPPHLNLTPTNYYYSSVPSTATAVGISLPFTFDTTKTNRTDGISGNLSNTNRPNPFYYGFTLSITPTINTPFVLSSWNGQPDTAQTFTPPSGAVTVRSNWVGPNTFKSGLNTSAGTMTLSGW